MKRTKSVSEKITEYIIENNLSASQISRDTGVSEGKLINKTASLNASEFLAVCAYLNIRPEDLREKE